MEVKKLKHLTKKDRKVYDAGCKAGDQQNYKYAGVMFRNLLKKVPGALDVREKLREYQLKRIGSEANTMRQNLAPVVKIVNIITGPGLIKKGKFSEALDNAEKAMAFDPTAPACLTLLANAAEAADFLVLAQETLELAHKHHPQSYPFLESLARIYGKLGMGNSEFECWEKIVKLDPKNAKYKKRLEEARVASANDNADPEDVAFDAASPEPSKKGKKKEEPLPANQAELEKSIKMQENTVRSRDTTESRKKLGDLYAVAKDYEKALENYHLAAEMATVIDADLDAAMTRITVYQYDASIEEWQHYLAGGGLSDEEVREANEQIESLQTQKAEMLIGRSKERVQRQPHAVGERFTLAKYLWKFRRLNEAIGEFQQTQGNAQYKEQSLLFLAKCYYGQKQYKKAVELLEKAIPNMPRMNKLKKCAYYDLALCYRALKNTDEEWKYLSNIYAVDEDYKDVRDIVEDKYQKELMNDY